MKRQWRESCKVLAGLFLVTAYALPQAYTISAKPGAVNYVEGVAYLNGSQLSEKANRATFIGANDTLSTGTGKAEVLLSPGVFLRIGDHSQIRMIAPSLVNTQLEVTRGEAMIEVSGLVKDNTVKVIDHGGSITLTRDGLYRINADDPPRVAVLDGKALVNFGTSEANLGKGREMVLSEAHKPGKFDAKKPDDLYAWSNSRSAYAAAASYQAANNVASSSFAGWGGYGFGGWSSPGWYWANGFNSWAWLPGDGAFYSPFGYGFYSPGVVAYAPVVAAPVYGYNGANHGPWNGHRTGGQGATASVPVNPNRPPAVGAFTASPAANQAARAQAAQSFAATGFQTRSGAPAVSFAGSRATVWSGGSANSAGAGAWSAAHSAGGVSGGHAGGGGWSGGAGHAGGGGWSGGAGHAGGAGMSAGASHSGAAPAGGAHR